MVLDRHQTDLYVRPSWLDAAVALHEIEKGKAEGRSSTLWVRSRFQKELYQLGVFLQRHAGKVLFVAILILATFCVGLKSAVINSKVDQLWIEEGGRLERELKYIEKTLGETTSNTNQLVIQTPKDPSASLLHSEALLTHLKVIRAASTITINVFNVPWRLKDICFSPTFPNFDMHLVDQIFNNLIPCAIITPLDCFWEGSKLIGPDAPVTVPEYPMKIKWTNLNPQDLLKFSKLFKGQFPVKKLEDIMKRAGITTGYQERPCLNPFDKDCPNTAPNKNSTQRLDVGAALTGGCYGFAPKYMHWPENLIIGSIKKNKTGHIVRAQGFQSVIQLMSDKELYEYYNDDYKVHHLDWNLQKASLVINTWQRKFSEEVTRQMKNLTENSAHYNMYSFSTTSLNDVLSQFSKINFKKIVVGYLVMLIFVAFSLFKWNNAILSQTAVGIAGVMLVALTNAAALGFCAVFGITFNASTTQIVPYLGLGLGVIDMFLLTSSYAQESSLEFYNEESTGAVLKRSGLSVVLTSMCNIGAFLAALIIPIPALRVFCLQAGILAFFNLVTSLFVFPAIISIDLRRRRSGRIDIFCCCCIMPGNGKWPFTSSKSSSSSSRKSYDNKKQAVTCALPPDRQQTVTVLAQPVLGGKNENPLLKGLLSSDPGDGEYEKTPKWSMNALLESYAKFLCKRSTKVMTIIAFIIVMLLSIWNLTKVVDGLDLSDIVPPSTNEHKFLAAQEKYFGFYNMYAVTQGDFEYPTNQKLLYEYHEAFTRIPNIIKNDNGGLPPFWLGLFRDWLISLQKAFDREYASECITQEGWCANATDDAIVAYKLMVQTGYVENPIDKTQISQIRLVDKDGIINPDAFYNYLSAWVCNDALAYSHSQANFKPEPKPWCYTANDYDLKIPKSPPLIYAQFHFYLRGLESTFQMTKMISQVREICERFEIKGLPNFPSGIPFIFWEQYQNLRMYVASAVFCSLATVFVIVFILLFNLWAATVVCLGGISMVLQLLGCFVLVGIKFSAVPAVLLTIAVGINTHFVIHTCYSFLTAIGTKERRLELAIKHIFPVILHSAIATLLAVTMLAFNDFDFIVRYFFYALSMLIGVGIINGLLFFPMFLLLVGPPSELKPLKYPDRISTPSPEPVKKHHQSNSKAHRQIPTSFRRHRQPSLSTITEEPGSWHSTTHEIVVEPELVVETTTFTQPNRPDTPSSGSDCNENGSSCDSSPVSVHKTTPSMSTSNTSASSSNHVTTKVTATAKFKVEVHTPIHSSFDRCHRYSSRRRDSTSSTSTTSTECLMKHFS